MHALACFAYDIAAFLADGTPSPSRYYRRGDAIEMTAGADRPTPDVAPIAPAVLLPGAWHLVREGEDVPMHLALVPAVQRELTPAERAAAESLVFAPMPALG